MTNAAVGRGLEKKCSNMGGVGAAGAWRSRYLEERKD